MLLFWVRFGYCYMKSTSFDFLCRIISVSTWQERRTPTEAFSPSAHSVFWYSLRFPFYFASITTVSDVLSECAAVEGMQSSSKTLIVLPVSITNANAVIEDDWDSIIYNYFLGEKGKFFLPSTVLCWRTKLLSHCLYGSMQPKMDFSSK